MAMTSAHLQSFDKGLRSSQLAEQLATVSGLGKLLDENPVPMFVNALIVRLADAFRDGPNSLRVVITRILGQCGSQLTLAFSSAEIFRRVLTVSYSNDPEARECTLDMLASLAPILPESKQAHHLISESLATRHDGEFRAACTAMQAFAKLSSHFAGAIIADIAKLVIDPMLPSIRKIRLANVVATMYANAQTMEDVFTLTKTVIDASPGDDVLAAFLESTTTLSIATRFAIPIQLDLLLHIVEQRHAAAAAAADGQTTEERPTSTTPTMKATVSTSTPSPPPLPAASDAHKDEESGSAVYSDQMVVVVLKQIHRLATYANLWSVDQIAKLTRLQPPTLSPADRRLLRGFLDVAVTLSTNCSSPQIAQLCELVQNATSLATLDNDELRVRYVELVTNVLCVGGGRVVLSGGGDEKTCDVTTATLESIAVAVATFMDSPLSLRLSQRLHRACGNFLLTQSRMEGLEKGCAMLLDAVLHAFSLDDGHPNDRQRVEMLCNLVDRDTFYAPHLQAWAVDLHRSNPTTFGRHPQLLGFLMLASGTELPATVRGFVFDDDSLRYDIARTALRNGHWKHVALPNLAAICGQTMTSVQVDWVRALKELAASQIFECNMDELVDQQRHLYNSVKHFQVAIANARYAGVLRFPLELVTCMYDTTVVLSHLLSTVNPFYTVLNAAIRPGAYFNPIAARRLAYALGVLEPKVAAVATSWTSLCRSSFCADATSLDIVTLYYTRVSVVLASLRLLLGRRSSGTMVQMQPLVAPRTVTISIQETLKSAVRQLESETCQDLPNSETLECFVGVVRQMALMPNILPRFFFQQFYNVDFKLSVTPQSESGKLNLAAGQTSPLRVDGSLTSTHPAAIVAVVIIADFVFPANHKSNFELRERAEPNERNFFHVQFLTVFNQSCEVKFGIEFIDAQQRQWKSPTTAALLVNVRETAVRSF